MSLIQFENVNYIYGVGTTFEKQALKNICFTVESGSFIGLIGHTGSGKSTLIQHMNGLIRPTSGKIYFHDEDITADGYKKKGLRSKVGIVFQYPEYQLFEIDVLADVAFGPKNLGLSQEEAKKRAIEALQLVGIKEEQYTLSPFELSGGQKRRVAIAGVVALRPAILILDEATSMLDPEGRRELIETVKGIRKDYDMTVISITHDLEEVAMSDRVLVMKKGEIESTSSPRELFSRNDLDQIGLDDPFSNQLKHSLSQNGYDLPENYLTESELEDKLWELL